MAMMSRPAPCRMIGNAREAVLNDLRGLLEVLAGGIAQGKPAEFKALALPRRIVLHVDEFEAAAAEIARKAIGPIKPREHAKAASRASSAPESTVTSACRISRTSAMKAGPFSPGGRRRWRAHRASRPASGRRARGSASSGNRLFEPVLWQEAGDRDLTAKAAEALFVEHRNGRTRMQVIGDHTHGVRPDIDDRDRPVVSEPAGRLSGASASFRQGAGARKFERGATTRQARIRHEIAVSIEGLLALRGTHARGRAIRQDPPALFVVEKVGLHDLASTCSCTVALMIGHRASTRRSRLRGMRSAEAI